MDTFAIIIDLLRQSGKEQKALADFLGVTQQTICDWKAGRNKSYLKQINKIAEFLNVSIDYLLGNDKKNKPADEICELQEKINRIAADMTTDELLKLIDYAELLIAARNSPKNK